MDMGMDMVKQIINMVNAKTLEILDICIAIA